MKRLPLRPNRNTQLLLIPVGAIVIIYSIKLIDGNPTSQVPYKSHPFQQWHLPPLQQLQGIRNSGSCHMSNVPCSGHTWDSCTRYCHSIGFPHGSCQGPCCLCSSVTNPSVNIPPTISQQSPNNQMREPELFLAEESRNPYQSQSLIKSGPFQKVYSPPSKGKWYDSLPRRSAASIPTNASIGVCETEDCLAAATRLQRNMNRNVDPCEDFYEYACGGFVQRTEIPEDASEVTTFTLLRDKMSIRLRSLLEEPTNPRKEPSPFTLAKTLYASCTNTGAIEALGLGALRDGILGKIGSWPVLHGNKQVWSKELFTWSNYVVWLRELGFSHDIFIKISVDPDLKNVRKRVLTVGEPVLGLPRELLVQGLSEPNVKAYYKYMVETAVLFGAERAAAEGDMYKVLQFEIRLAKSFHRPEGSRASTYYLPTTIGELKEKYGSTPWLELFQRISTISTINTGEMVVVTAPHYLDAFYPIIASTEVRTLGNYAVWRTVASSMTYLNEPARALQFQFSSTISGQRVSVPRWKECVEIVSLSMGNAVGSMYVRRFFPPTAKAEAEEMIRNIHSSFFSLLEEADWMDERTKGKAREKASGISVHVGYPKEQLNDALLTKLYQNYDFSPTDYLGNARNLALAATNAAFLNLRKPIVRNDWVSHGKSSAVNAFYLPLDNAIQFPAGILQDPFFDNNRPRYLNYGAIGWVVGHEVTHGFDDQGHQFDKEGNFVNWWDPFTKQTYETKTHCIIGQYGKYNGGTGSGMIKVNGVNSQGENIADNGGIKQAYRGYQSWVEKNGREQILPGFEGMSPNQMFWISAANNWCSIHREERLRNILLTGAHAPGKIRVTGTFSNTAEFSKDFQCPLGSPMNPIQKCSVW